MCLFQLLSHLEHFRRSCRHGNGTGTGLYVQDAMQRALQQAFSHSSESTKVLSCSQLKNVKWCLMCAYVLFLFLYRNNTPTYLHWLLRMRPVVWVDVEAALVAEDRRRTKKIQTAQTATAKRTPNQSTTCILVMNNQAMWVLCHGFDSDQAQISTLCVFKVIWLHVW